MMNELWNEYMKNNHSIEAKKAKSCICFGVSEKEAAAALADRSLTYKVVGSGNVVTGQIPAMGAEVPGKNAGKSGTLPPDHALSGDNLITRCAAMGWSAAGVSSGDRTGGTFTGTGSDLPSPQTASARRRSGVRCRKTVAGRELPCGGKILAPPRRYRRGSRFTCRTADR